MSGTDEALPATMAWRSLRAMCRRSLARQAELAVEGIEHVPLTGPVVIAARHYHHLLDGCAIGTAIDRHLHILVASDWASGGLARGVLDRATRVARWPVVLRPDAPRHRPDRFAAAGARVAYDAAAARAMRRAARETVDLLRGGHALLVFPEGYPTIDPTFTPKTRDDEVLPFQPGVIRLVALAQADGRTRVPVVPAGLEYEGLGEDHWRMALRFGEPMAIGGPDRAEEIAALSARVRELSGLTREAAEADETGDVTADGLQAARG
ncbi:MAG: 1-acyl-sn-glycerol-3-phosphate acyltransferase [Thermomicrobiales bacterium]